MALRACGVILAACLALTGAPAEAAEAGHAALAPAAAPAAAALAAQLAARPHVRANFEQERRLRGFAAPLRSRGWAVLSRDYGLAWHQTEPFVMDLTITDTFISQVLPGQSVQLLTADSHPGLFRHGALLRQLAAADLAALQRLCEVQLTAPADGVWQLRLIPRGGGMERIFSAIEVSGGDYMHTILLHGAQGDDTTITLGNVTDLAPGEELRRHFEH